MNSRLIRAGLALAFVATATGGCAGIGKALGGGKNPPDEFAIATKAPLVVPPDYALRPPRPGETRPQELSPSQRAQQVLIGDVSAAPPTPGEQYLLRKANALAADPNIRNIIAAENGGRAEKDRSLANQLIFWKFIGGQVDDSAAPLRVDDPEAWFAARQRAIEAVVGEQGEVVIRKDDKTLSLPGVF
ncbi:DUF3035 domain-containing protein [Amphiplicatus metriothermophilus]|uniref:Beta-barrel assembly machine subunit BamF n=1 Tax=Amphiplicatus metriothermophilus TaxID=1519374 RepID=A0A239PIX4_9PROT|nr:DUF3035 domain-containing protein [Amphiplicatus metriothermophilus]MBB5517931.1 hypothetical protein [Amphiplicatus metriothermophilus]SNT67736.1 Beta-barrel assembly machine subunit BamF [Amphiplicatus metriothermophilus]